jgi:Mg2+-importing ATPase
MAIGVWLPFSPFASALGFTAMPPLYWPLLLVTLSLYVLVTQSVKTWLLKKAWI